MDFAQARDDLYEWECRQRMLAREERHRRKLEEDRLRPPSPPPIVHYSEHECSQLGDKIKGWQTRRLTLTGLSMSSSDMRDMRVKMIYLSRTSMIFNMERVLNFMVFIWKHMWN